MINFGIDLGTTNSAIAKFDQGRVEIFRNPMGLKDTLPSVVAFRKGRILVGDKAREYLMRAPTQVLGSFKRKMGTSESYQIEGQEQALSPVDLSAQVLKELKTFVHTGERVDAAVVTIPASFDTIQSNATKAAGLAAGFSQVVLLQEPIAASLAYANREETDAFDEGQWLVYDLGGGTFDVALVSIHDGEMKVVDHEGDNFLGGTDFDQEIVEKLLVPYLEDQGQFDQLLAEMRSASGRYNALYYKLLYLAEIAKLQVSASAEAEIEFETEDDTGTAIEGLYTLQRAAFEQLLAPHIARTIDMMQRILKRNQLKPADLKFVLLVGGSTYIPYVRTQVAEELGVPVNTQIDPTTAVAVGAAFYAGTQRREAPASAPASQPDEAPRLQVKTAYQKATQESAEYFTARFEGAWEGLFYRITREDGGFDSGLKPLAEQIQEDLPLLKDQFNQFQLQVFDDKNNTVAVAVAPIGITQGRYSVVGQPLPHDICLEIDDIENNTTVLEVVFEKNSILPVRRTLVKQMTRTIAKGADDRLTITVVEGPGSALPATTQPIGFISVSGEELNRDLVRGSDIEITLEISESRDLTIGAYLLMTDQEFVDVFTPSVRQVNVPRLSEELYGLAEKIRAEIREAESQDNFEAAQELVDLEYEILGLADQAQNLAEDDVTDRKFQLEDRKRKLAQRVDELTRDKFIIRIKNEYFETKRFMELVLDEYEATEADREAYAKLLDQEKACLATNSSLKIQELIDRIRALNWRIRWRSPRFLKAFFLALVFGQYGSFTHQAQADAIIARGQEALKEDNPEKLRICINQLCELLPPAQRKSVQFGGTGIG